VKSDENVDMAHRLDELERRVRALEGALGELAERPQRRAGTRPPKAAQGELKAGDWVRPSEAASYYRRAPRTIKRWAEVGLLKSRSLPSGRKLVQLGASATPEWDIKTLVDRVMAPCTDGRGSAARARRKGR